MVDERGEVVVVGGGNAALCAALAAADAGARVRVVDRAPASFRGGNTRHTRNLRDAHGAADGFVTGPYRQDEFLADLAGVSGNDMNVELAMLTVAESESLPAWMWAHGARWQAPLNGTLHLARTNHFFLGGGKALLNAYYRAALARGVKATYDCDVRELVMDNGRCVAVRAEVGGTTQVLPAAAVVVASGGFEANRAWLRKYWGDRVDHMIVRGTPYNPGHMLRFLLDMGVRSVGNERAVHGIAVDARAPVHDGGIATRLDAIPFGIAVNRHGARFYDEGEDIWPKRYATWGARIADQPDQIAFAILDSKGARGFIPGMYRPFSATSIAGLADLLGIDAAALGETVSAFNAHCPTRCSYSMSDLDDCSTSHLDPPKSH